MSEIVLFNFESHDIRYVGDGIKHEWVAADVCEALNLTNVSKALARLDEDEKGITSSDTPGGEQELLTVNEPGMYGLVLGSRKPEAKRFKRWLKHEVLPAIREKGAYFLKQSQKDKNELPPQERAEVLLVLTNGYKARYGEAYAQSYWDQQVRKHFPSLAGDPAPALERASHESKKAFLTPTDIGKELGIVYKTGRGNAREVNKLLERLGYQIKVEADPPWSPTEKGDPFSDLKPVSTGSRTDKNQLFWLASILDELRDQNEGGVAA